MPREPRASTWSRHEHGGGRSEVAQRVEGYSNAQTTGLYDQYNDDISVSEVEKGGFERMIVFR